MELTYQKSRYTVDDTLAIIAWEGDDEHGYEPYGHVTVNVSAYYHFPLDDTLVILPTYKMDKEFIETVKNDLVERELGEPIPIGYGEGQLVKLKKGWESSVRMLPEDN
jgi:hypothetical protein